MAVAYDEKLAERIRGALGCRGGISEKKMFGGLAFLLGGKMLCGIVKNDLMVRVGPGRYGEALGRPHVRPMDFTGHPMRGFVFVSPAACDSEEAVAMWVKWGAEFVGRLDSAGSAGVGKRNRPVNRDGRSS